jgi:hypothetical protein
MKNLSEQIAALTEKLDALQQSVAKMPTPRTTRPDHRPVRRRNHTRPCRPRCLAVTLGSPLVSPGFAGPSCRPICASALADSPVIWRRVLAEIGHSQNSK